MKADIEAVADRGEATTAMEPLVLSDGSRHRPALSDVAVELAAASAGFRRSLPPGVVKALADLVRAMNCYYSNLIEGHNTHPVDIERAMKNVQPMADAGWDPGQSIARQLTWCRDAVEGKQVETPPGPFTMALMATREFDMYGQQPELAMLINEIERAMIRHGYP